MKKGKSEHWNEIDTTKEPIKCFDGVIYPLTDRAWDERVKYAIEYVAKLEGVSFNSDGTFNKAAGKKRETYEEKLERYKDIVMVRIRDRHEEHLVTPADFAKKHNISPQGINIFLNDSNRKQVQGWTSKDRLHKLDT